MSATPVAVVTEEIAATPPASRALRALVDAVAVAMSLYHMYVAAFGPPEWAASRSAPSSRILWRGAWTVKQGHFGPCNCEKVHRLLPSVRRV